MSARARLEADKTPPADDQRLDKWLWYARVVKTRTLAARLVVDGHVRVNGARNINPAKRVRTGDVLTIALVQKVRVLRVLAPGDRRGPFAEAQNLLEDLVNSETGARR